MRIAGALLLATMGAFGCASPAEIRYGANEHLAKAQHYEAYGDHYHAAKERSAAEHQFAKARDRASWWY
jgi:hypothetical protein